MPSHPDRVRANYKCQFCRGTGHILLTNDNDPLDIQSFTCGVCRGTGYNISYKQTIMEGIPYHINDGTDDWKGIR